MAEAETLTPAPPPQGNLARRLAWVMSQVGYVQKRGTNNFHNYKYATETDIVDSIRWLLAEARIVMIPNVVNHSTREIQTAKGRTEYITDVLVEFTFHCGDSGDTIKFVMAGSGQDAGDKGVYKALTGAEKYALMKCFLVPTGDDPEADSEGDKPPPKQQPPQIQPRQTQQRRTTPQSLAHPTDPTPPPTGDQQAAKSKLPQEQLAAIHAAGAKWHTNLSGDALDKVIHDELCGHYKVASLSDLTNVQADQAVHGYANMIAKREAAKASNKVPKGGAA